MQRERDEENVKITQMEKTDLLTAQERECKEKNEKENRKKDGKKVSKK